MEKKVYARAASGLVREAGLLDVTVLNYGFTGASFSICLAFMISQSMWAYPGCDFGIAQMITLVLTVLASALAYSLLSIAMPRAGGDYIYVSRTIYPSIGFATNFTVAIMLSFFVAWGSYWGAGMALSNLLTILGYMLNNATLVSWGVAVATREGLFITSTILIVLFGLLCISGLRWFFRFCVLAFVVGSIGMIMGWAMSLTNDVSTFASKFNQFMLLFTTKPDYFHEAIKVAKDAGFTPDPGFSWCATLMILPIVAFSSLYAYGSAYIGGEVKEARKSQIYGMVLGLALLAVFNSITYWLIVNSAGYEFLSAINWLYWGGGPLELPLWPYFNLFMMIMSANVGVAALIGLGFFLLSVLFVPMNMILITRMIFSWAFDRVMPSKLAEVHERTHSPVNAIIAVCVIAELFLAIYTYTPWFTTLSGIMGCLFAYLMVGITALIFPFKAKSIYEASPSIVRYKLGKIPAISILGVIATVYFGYVICSYLVNPLYLVNSPESLTIVFGTLIGGFIIFYLARAYRKRQGIDIDLAYAEIPPE